MKQCTVWLTGDGTVDVMVAATSKRHAAELMGRSLYSFNQYASDLLPTHPSAQLALAHPGVVFVKSNRNQRDAWIERDIADAMARYRRKRNLAECACCGKQSHPARALHPALCPCCGHAAHFDRCTETETAIAKTATPIPEPRRVPQRKETP